MIGRGWLIVLAIATAACGGRLPSAERAEVHYAAVPSPWPAGRACINQERGAIVAKEVLMGRTKTVVVAGGANPISDDAWETFSPGLFNQKNSDRHTLFTRSCFARSPEAPADCVAEACRRVVENGGRTWVQLSKIEAVDCTPTDGGCDPAHVRGGQLAIVVTRKCHELVFEGRVVLLRGPHGEEAVMHATANGVPTTDVTCLQVGSCVRRHSIRRSSFTHSAAATRATTTSCATRRCSRTISFGTRVPVTLERRRDRPHCRAWQGSLRASTTARAAPVVTASHEGRDKRIGTPVNHNVLRRQKCGERHVRPRPGVLRRSASAEI